MAYLTVHRPHSATSTVASDRDASITSANSFAVSYGPYVPHPKTTISTSKCVSSLPYVYKRFTGCHPAITATSRIAPRRVVVAKQQPVPSKLVGSSFPAKPTPELPKLFDASNVKLKPDSLVGTVLLCPAAAKGSLTDRLPIEPLIFRLDRVLQKAIYGAVFGASEFKCSGGQRIRKVALKVMLKSGPQEPTAGHVAEDIHAETRFRAAMSGHQNLLVHDYSWEDKKAIYVAMEFAEFGDLFEIMKKRRTGFPEEQARWLFRQLLLAAEHLHKRGVAFRDHSLENVLFFVDSVHKGIVPRVTDPGHAVFLNGSSLVPHGKLFGKSFRAPEVYLKQPYDPIKIDTFCLGWILFFVLTKRQAFEKALYSDPDWRHIIHMKYHDLLVRKNSTHLSKDCKDLLFSMLNPEYNTRPSITECLSHPWFSAGPIAAPTVRQLFNELPKAQ